MVSILGIRKDGEMLPVLPRKSFKDCFWRILKTLESAARFCPCSFEMIRFLRLRKAGKCSPFSIQTSAHSDSGGNSVRLCQEDAGGWRGLNFGNTGFGTSGDAVHCSPHTLAMPEEFPGQKQAAFPLRKPIEKIKEAEKFMGKNWYHFLWAKNPQQSNPVDQQKWNCGFWLRCCSSLRYSLILWGWLVKPPALELGSILQGWLVKPPALDLGHISLRFCLRAALDVPDWSQIRGIFPRERDSKRSPRSETKHTK